MKKLTYSDSPDQFRTTGQGKFQLLPQQVQVDFDDGSAIIAPAGEATIQAASVRDTVGTIVDIACRIFPSLCEKDSGDNCYTIIGPDGTKITICPPKAA